MSDNHNIGIMIKQALVDPRQKQQSTPQLQNTPQYQEMGKKLWGGGTNVAGLGGANKVGPKARSGNFYVNENNTTVKDYDATQDGGPMKNRYFYDKSSGEWKPLTQYQGDIDVDSQGKPTFSSTKGPAIASRSEQGHYNLAPGFGNRYKMTYRQGKYHATPHLSEKDIEMRKMLKLPAGTALGPKETIVGYGDDGKAITSSGASYDMYKHRAGAPKDRVMSPERLRQLQAERARKAAQGQQDMTSDPIFKDWLAQKRLASNYGLSGWAGSGSRSLGNFFRGLGGYDTAPRYREDENFKNFRARVLQQKAVNQALDAQGYNQNVVGKDSQGNPVYRFNPFATAVNTPRRWWEQLTGGADELLDPNVAATEELKKQYMRDYASGAFNK